MTTPDSAAQEELARLLCCRPACRRPGTTPEGVPLCLASESMADAQAVLAWMKSSGYVRQGWQDISTAPRDGTPITVGQTMRYLPYKPDGKRQMQAEGRWQAWNGYGWTNCEDPEQWMPTPPVPPTEK